MMIIIMFLPTYLRHKFQPDPNKTVRIKKYNFWTTLVSTDCKPRKFSSDPPHTKPNFRYNLNFNSIIEVLHPAVHFKSNYLFFDTFWDPRKTNPWTHWLETCMINTKVLHQQITIIISSLRTSLFIPK